MAETADKILKALETVSFPEFDIHEVTAKIDTGAFNGSLHCTKIQELDTPEGKILQFSPFDHPEIHIKTADFAVDYVRSSNGHQEDRYFVKTRITLRSESYPITLSLADRSRMTYPVLIGRSFLRKHHFLVDVAGR